MVTFFRLLKGSVIQSDINQIRRDDLSWAHPSDQRFSSEFQIWKFEEEKNLTLKVKLYLELSVILPFQIREDIASSYGQDTSYESLMYRYLSVLV